MTVKLRAKMTENTSLPPIRAHQQSSFPLLRRPRPPKPAPTKRRIKSTASSVSRDTTSAAEELLDPDTVEEKLQTVSTPLHPLPRHHPTPISLHRHPPLPHTLPRHNYTSTPLHHHSQTHSSSLGTYKEEEEKEDDLADASAEVNEDNGVTIYPLFPRGPQFLPPGRKTLSLKHKSPPRPWWETGEGGPNLGDVAPSGGERKHCEFMLGNFQFDPEEPAAPSKLKGSVISRQNYLKLTGWFTTHVPQQDTVNTMDITVDHQAQEGRKPHHQILLELEVLIKEALESSSSAVTTDNDRAVKMNEEKQEEEEEEGEELCVLGAQWPSPSPGDVVFRSSTSRYFCGQGRSDSPFDGGGQPLVSPAEVAILESMMEGGQSLSLKAHFLSSLPSLSPLSRTLAHLNLSFNNLSVFPSELVEMTQLQSLRMRSNPIRDIPSGIIRALAKLEVFCISFNILSHLPSDLFELTSLTELDVSHNSLQRLSRDVNKLRNLRKLNVEGNELIGLPPSLLSLPLTHVLISGNFMHPALWRESCRAPPQALTDLCCTAVSKYATGTAVGDDDILPSSARTILHDRCRPGMRCDFCNGPIFGSEVKSIKPRSARSDDSPVKSLPVLFRLCSLTCKLQHRDIN